jgi:ribosomal-protein-alanine N-acetyltransferase
MSTWDLRDMHENDLSEVISLVSNASEFPWKPGNIIDSLHSSLDASFVLCERRSGLILAYAVLHFIIDESQLLNLSVLKEYQGEGLGTALLQQLMLLAQSRNSQQMLLEVRASNAVAIRIYEKQGFKKIAERKAYYPSEGGREDALLYSRSLS